MTLGLVAWALASGAAVVLLVGGLVALRLRVAGALLLVGLAVVAALVSAVPLVPWAGTQDAVSGDCLGELPDADVRRLDVVDCASPHEAQVFDVVELPRALDTPSTEALASRVFRICVERLERLEGAAWADLDLAVQTVRPSPASLEDGDRQVLCLASARDGGTLTRQVG